MGISLKGACGGFKQNHSVPPVYPVPRFLSAPNRASEGFSLVLIGDQSSLEFNFWPHRGRIGGLLFQGWRMDIGPLPETG